MEEQKNFKIFLSGVPNSGKTTFLYKLKLKEIISTLPTIGYNVETVKFLGKNYEFWDVNNKHLPKYLEEEKTQTQTAGIIHLIRDGSEESKKSLVILINILVSMNLNVPILVLMNSENDLKINQPFINQNYEEEVRKVINYKGNINFIWFSTSHCTDVASFLENNFSLK